MQYQQQQQQQQQFETDVGFITSHVAHYSRRRDLDRLIHLIYGK